MLIQEQRNKLFLLEKQIIKLGLITFLKSQKKPFYSFQKKQQEFFNWYKWLNTVK